MATSEVRAAIAEHANYCAQEGAVCGVWEEIGKMRTKQNDLELAQAKIAAVFGFWKWALPIVATLLGAGATVFTALFLRR
jgi:hypothetical protein